MQATRPPLGGPLTTYARRKGKPRALQISSSPVKATDRDDLSLVEMTRRMKKRARQSVNSAFPDLERGLTDLGKFPKRLKDTHAVASAISSDSDSLCSSSIFPLESLTSLNDGTNNLQYQTPFNLSPVSSPTAPDPLSPVPPSRRHLSATSRNLKENRSVKRLASPFHSRSVSKACSRSGSRTNSPSKVKKPPFYIKARTRSEANARSGESVTDEVSLPVCGSLPALGSMKAAVCDHDPADSTTAYMLENLSTQDWFRPAKALSRSPFSEDYIPPGTPFQEWDYSAETFLGGTPLQTSTPNAVKRGAVRRHKSTDALSSAPNTVDPTHPSNDVNYNTMDPFNAEGLESGRVMRRHRHDSIFSSFDASTTLSTSIIRPNSLNTKSTLQGDPAFSTVTRISDPGQAVVNLSGMLDCLDIDGMKNSSPNFVQRSRSLDGTHPASNSPSSATRQIAGRRRDRASTIRASDYIVKPITSLSSGGVTSTTVSALTTRTRSGTIRPARPPMTSSANVLPVATPQSCAGHEQTQSGNPSGSSDPLGSDKKLHGSPTSSQGKLGQKARFSGAVTTESMILDAHDDESDDELLLDHRGWNWDGNWD